jgi:hypothetical protein
MEQKTIFKIEWKDLKVVAVAYHEQESDPKSRFGTKPKIRPVFGLIVERVDKNERTIKVFEILK